MDFGSILGNIGNFLGGIFNPQKKKQDQPAPSRPTPATSLSQNIPGQTNSPQMPAALTIHFQPPTAPTPQLGGVTAPTPPSKPNQPAKASPVQPKSFLENVGDLVRNNPVLNAAAIANPITALPAIINDIPKMPQQARDLGAGIVDSANFATRVPQTINTALDSVGLGDAATTNKAYGQVQNTLQGVSDFISGHKGTANADTTSEANAISSGQANPGQILDAAIKSLGAATTVPAGRLLGTAAKAEVPAILGGVEDNAAAKAATGELSPPVKPTIIEPKPTEPNSPIISVNETGANKPAAITSNNQPVAQTPVVRAEPPVVTPVQPLQAPTVAPTTVNPPAIAGGVQIPTVDASRTMTLAKPSVRGGSQAVYNTDDPNLNQIMKSAIVAAKGTAKSAGEHSDALAKAGLNSDDVKAIRDFAVKNADQNGTVDSAKLGDFVSSRLNPASETESIASQGGARPANDIQSQIETAHNAGDDAKAADLVNQLPPEMQTPMRSALNIPEPTPASELGTISKKAVASGAVKSDADAQVVAKQVEDAINKAATDAGSSWDKINQKLQAASSNPKITTYEQAGLSPAEADVAQKAAEEASFVRDRIDPSLRSGGQQDFYAPKQALDETGASQKYDPNLVNEIRRDKGGGVPADQIDHSTTPYNHLIRRYLNAADAGTSRLKSMIETDAKGATTGAKLSPDAEAQIHQHMQDMVDARDEAMRLNESGDIKGANKAIDRGGQSINKAINTAADDIPKNVSNRQEIINGITDMRGTYNQSLVRTLGFSNVINRAADQAQKGMIVMTNKAIPIANKIAGEMVNKATGGGASLMATGRDAGQIAKQYSKGTLQSQLSRNFRATIDLAGAGRNPLLKGIAKVDAAIRGAGTYVTGAGDLTTEAARIANMKILGDAQEAGITDKVGMEQYLRDHLNSSDYKEAYNRSEGTMAGYLGLPDATVGKDSAAGKVSGALSKYVDNAITNGLTKAGVPTRVARELNDTIAPTLTGFAGATSRIAAKSMNAVALGIPQIRAALTVAKTGMPGATEQAQLMISRSLIDTVSAGGVAAGGLLLAQHAHWTGAYPTDPNEKARWAKDGTEADSFEFDIGDKKIYIQPGRILGALAIPLNAAAAVGSGQDPATAVTDTINQFVDNLGGSSIMQHVTDVNNLLNGNASSKASAAKALQNSFVPSTGILGNVANWQDSQKRTANNALDTLQSRLPGLRENLPAALDARGNPIPNAKQLSGGSAILATGDNPNAPANAAADPVNAEIERLAAAGHDVTPTTSAKNATNANTQGLAAALLNDKLYTAADDKTKAAMLKGVVDGTSVKDINPNLSPADQQALLDSKLLGNKQKAWLDDNENNASYTQAEYNNAKANDTLTKADEDLKNPSGLKYKAIEAQVDQKLNTDYSTKSDYKNTSQSEFKAMLNPKSDTYDPEAATKMYEYDQARVAAGLPPKYNLAKAQAGSKGRGGGGSNSFAFANLPASLMGTGSTGSGSGSGYASNAPLFTPIASLQAPQGAAIPKGRTISVVKGK